MSNTFIELCGECAEHMAKHFDFIKAGAPVSERVRCFNKSCEDEADISVLLPERISFSGIGEGVRNPQKYTNEYVFSRYRLDRSEVMSALDTFIDFESNVRGFPVAGGAYVVGIERGYSVTCRVGIEPLVDWMANFGKTKRMSCIAKSIFDNHQRDLQAQHGGGSHE